MHIWSVIDVESFPQQEPGSVECGVFLMKSIEQIAYDNKIKFKHQDMQRYRAEIAALILKHAKIGIYTEDQISDVPKCEEGDSIMET